MIGSSLAFAINSLDQLVHHPSITSAPSLTGSSSPSSASSVGTISPVDPAQSPELDEMEPGAFHLYQLQQQRLQQQLHLQQQAAATMGEGTSPRAAGQGGVGAPPPPRMTIPGNMTALAPHYLSHHVPGPQPHPHHARLPVPPPLPQQQQAAMRLQQQQQAQAQQQQQQQQQQSSSSNLQSPNYGGGMPMPPPQGGGGMDDGFSPMSPTFAPSPRCGGGGVGINMSSMNNMCNSSSSSTTSSAPSSSSTVGANNGINGNRAALFETTAGIELVQVLLETESRALILFNVETIPAELLMVACEKLGSLAYLRMDFRACRGVVFLAYHDLRASIRAFHTLARDLAALCLGNSGETRPPAVHYSIMLNAATTPRDGILLVRDGSVPAIVQLTESDVQAVFSSYGQLKNVHRRMISTSGMPGAATAFLVEYYDVQVRQSFT